MGFDFVGFEIDSEYHKMATERLEAVKSQVRLEGINV
jgi:DNA modification methylase